MDKMTDRPRWWQLYILGFVVIGLILLARLWHVNESVHATVNIGIVLCAYGVLNMWLGVNSAALEREELQSKAQRTGQDAPLTQRQAAYRRAVEHQDRIKK